VAEAEDGTLWLCVHVDALWVQHTTFYIIIIATCRISFHCYLPSYIVIYAFLVDFQDFPTKSPSLVYNS
jgi:hypothetical protein